MLPEIFLKLAKLYEENGFSLYMVGGTSRDFLLGKEISDFDFATDATPEQEKKFLQEGDYSFSSYGIIKIKHQGIHIDIATFRIEKNYLDYRHPSKVMFTKSMELDSKRRDFTINAIYIDKCGHVFDFFSGIFDLRNRILRFIGNPIDRIKEDPLRIIRGERFAKKLNLKIEKKSKDAIYSFSFLLDNLNPRKVEMERKKFDVLF
ncbi:MAG TPA: hypothetical protein DD377_02105 [Firmicutes bacterium]|nr:hypothetical protein [Bacillota bacterium]